MIGNWNFCSKQEFLGLFFVLSGVIYNVFGRFYERIFFILFALFFFAFNNSIKLYRIAHSPIDLVYTTFFITFIIDGFTFLYPTAVIYGISMQFCYIFTRTKYRNIDYDKFYHTVCVLITTIIVVVIFTGLLKKHIYFSNYPGIFDSPATFGLLVYSIPTLIYPLMANNLEQSRGVQIRYVVLIVFSAFFICISGCRTALVSFMIQTVAFFYINKRKCSVFLIVGGMGLVLLAIFLNIRNFSIYSIGIIYKFLEQKNRGDVFNHRTEFWSSIWESSSLFSGGRAFTTSISHNVYFGLMNAYGKINAFLYLLFVLMLLYKGWNYAKRNKTKWSIFPLMTTIAFFSCSMTENYLMTLSMVLMYITIPIMIENDGRWKKIEDGPKV